MNPSDLQIRLKAFEWLKEQILLHGEVLDYTLLHKGFSFNGHQIHMIGQTGIRMRGEGNIAQSIQQFFLLCKRKHLEGRGVPEFDFSLFQRPGQMSLF